jgi:hypothetical protein
MTNESLTFLLAERVMGWRIGPQRFLLGNRSWISVWRFKPLDQIEDAFALLEKACPEEYTMAAVGDGEMSVKVRIASREGEAREKSKPRAITFAIARALGLELPQREESGG